MKQFGKIPLLSHFCNPKNNIKFHCKVASCVCKLCGKKMVFAFYMLQFTLTCITKNLCDLNSKVLLRKSTCVQPSVWKALSIASQHLCHNHIIGTRCIFGVQIGFCHLGFTSSIGCRCDC